MKATVTIEDDDGNVIIRKSVLEPVEVVIPPIECIMDPEGLTPSRTTWFRFGVTEYMNSPVKMFIRCEKEDKK